MRWSIYRLAEGVTKMKDSLLLANTIISAKMGSRYRLDNMDGPDRPKNSQLKR